MFLLRAIVSLPEMEGRWSSEHPCPFSHIAPTHLHKGVDSHDGHVGLTDRKSVV